MPRQLSYDCSHRQLDYYRYKSAYDKIPTDSACANAKNTSNCSATNISSYFLDDSPFWHVDPPFLNLQVFPPFNTDAMHNASFTPSAGNMPTAWACGNRIIEHKDFTTQTGFSFPNVTGECNSGSQYRWGFSHLPLLAVCPLNFVAAAVFYMLWLFGNGDAEGDGKNQYNPGRSRHYRAG
jgi:hypothetical protein